MNVKTQTATAARSVMTSHVRFDFFHPHAKSVCIAGSFNNWNPSATRMVPVGHGRWVRELWLTPGIHQYLLVVDGEWVFDLNATDYLPNVFGGMNAIVEVLPAPKPSRADTRPKPAYAPRRRATEGERTASRVACCA